MNDQDTQEILRQLAEIRREARHTRRWIIFVAFNVSILLFLPGLAVSIAAWSEPMISFVVQHLAPALGILFTIVVSAIVVSHRGGAQPHTKETHNA